MKLLTDEHKNIRKRIVRTQNKCLEQPNRNIYTLTAVIYFEEHKIKRETKAIFFHYLLLKVRNTPTRVCRFIKTLLLQFCPNPNIPLQEHPKIRTLLEMLLSIAEVKNCTCLVHFMRLSFVVDSSWSIMSVQTKPL